jgi:hypothetical protein
MWFNRDVIFALKDKNRAFRKWKKTKSEGDMIGFHDKRKLFKKAKHNGFKQYLKQVDAEVKNNPKRLWGYIRSKTKTRRIPTEVEHLGVKASNIDTGCQLFSDYFLSTFQPKSDVTTHLPEAPQYGDESLSSFTISSAEVEQCLNNLDNNKSPGPDSIPIKVLKYCSKSLSPPLTAIFNHSIKSGTFPNKWKNAYVTPVLKKGSRYKVINYRPISLLSVLSKVFEKILHNTIYHHVSNHIAPEQHGFVRRRSTVTNLAEFTNDIAYHIDNKQQVDTIYTDFAKAFDSVNHSLLLHKIKGYGISGKLYELLESYLSERTQTVVMDGSRSTTENVTSGVPQGSILGPLLFTLYVNDIPKCFKSSKCLMYADDLKIYRTINNVQECLLLQTDLDNLNVWCSIWKLHLNISKCKVLTFTNKKKNVTSSCYYMNSTMLERVQVMRDLGVLLSSDLSYNRHLDTIKPKALRLLGLIRRNCAKQFSFTTNRLLYVALVRPQLEYASVIWNPYQKTKIDALERVQTRYVKMQCHRFNITFHRNDYVMHCNHMRIDTLVTRRRMADMIFLYKIINNLVDSPLIEKINFYVPPRTTRTLYTFHATKTRIDVSKHACINRLQNTFNILAQKNENLDLNFNNLSEFKSIVRNSS